MLCLDQANLFSIFMDSLCNKMAEMELKKRKYIWQNEWVALIKTTEVKAKTVFPKISNI